MKKILVLAILAGLHGQPVTINNSAPPKVQSSSAIVVGEAGTTTYYYWIVAKFTGGDAAPAGPLTLSQSQRAANFSTLRYNRISWTAVSGASSYDLLRTTTSDTPSGACACAVTTSLAAITYDDQATSTSAYTVNTAGPSYARIYLENLSESPAKLKQDVNGTISDIGSGGGGTYTAGPSGALNITGSVVDIDTAYVPGKTTSNTWTGANTFGGATSTIPFKVGTSDPGTCTVGEFLFRSDLGYMKRCPVTNTWVTNDVPVTVELTVFGDSTAAATGDGKFYLVIPSKLNGWILSAVSASVVSVGTTNTLDIQLARCATVATGSQCSGTVADMLSTKLTIDSNENKSSTAATPAVINAANDDVATDQVIRVDIDAINTTPSQGLKVLLTFTYPV